MAEFHSMRIRSGRTWTSKSRRIILSEAISNDASIDFYTLTTVLSVNIQFNSLADAASS